jgi:DDE superfamily endonuclease
VRHPRFHLHLIPTYSSWLNLVERWFAELTTRKLRRSAHRSVAELEADLRAWIDAWNQDPSHSCGPRPPMRSSTTSPAIFNESATQFLGLGDAAYAGKWGGRPLTSGVLGAGEGRNSV